MNYPLKMSHADSLPISVGPMHNREARAVAGMFTEIVEKLPYYNDRAKAAEIAKYTAEKLRSVVAVDPAGVLVGRAGTDPIGFCISNQDDGAMWLAWFGVRLEARNLGVGSAMLDALERRALQAGSHKIWCDSRTTNLPSGTLLTRYGYRMICTIADHWYRQDFILWEKFVG